MALHTNTNQQQPQQPQQPNRFTPIQPSSFGLQSQLLGMGSGGEVYEKIFSKIQVMIKRMTEEQKLDQKVTATKLLKGPHGLNYSGVVISETLGGVTASHVLMIEKTGNYPEKITDSYNNMRYEIVRTPGDALNVKYVNAAQQCVSNFLKEPLDSVIVVDGTLVPNEFDVESEACIAELMNNTVKAVQSEIEIRVRDYRGTNLQEYIQANPNGKFVVSLYFNSEDQVYLDQTGMPVRQDVCVVLSFKVGNGANSRDVNQGEDSVELVRTYGYIDFEFVGPQVVNNMLTSQKFVPNFIITHVEASVAPTPDVMMLGVASVLSLNEDMNWLQAFRPTVARKDVTDYNDVGALNLEGNIEQSPTGFGKRYDVKKQGVTTLELNKLMQTLSRPTMMVSIDIPKAGPETWYTSIFHHIADPKTSFGAYKRLSDFMSYATAGAYVASNVPVFEEYYNKIHGGFYKTKDGFRDVRHLSCYLGVVNHIVDTNQQPALITQYTNTLYNTQVPAELRAATRREYIDSMSNRTATYKQMYERRTFTSTFLIGWVNALRSIGFNPVYSNSATTNDMFVKRNTANFQSAILGQDVRLMTNANTMYNGWNQNANYVRNYY